MRADLDAMARVLRPVSKAQLRALGEAAIAAAYDEETVPVHPENGPACTDLAHRDELMAETSVADDKARREYAMVC